MLLVAYKCLDIDATGGGEGAARVGAVVSGPEFCEYNWLIQLGGQWAMTATETAPTGLRSIPEGNLQRINILLREYDTLRSELQQRTAAGFALVGVVVAVVGWVLSQTLSHHYYTSAAVGMLFLVFLFLGPRFMNVQIRRCAERVQRIEKRVNFLAQDHLLEWESRWGMGATGHHLGDDFPPDLQADQQLRIDRASGGPPKN
jgi:hypothetical protein